MSRLLVALVCLGLWSRSVVPACASTNFPSQVWTAVYSAEALLPQADSDGDGHRNWEECVAGTSPSDASSVFRVQSVLIHPQALLVRFASVAGIRYQLETNPTLIGGSWSLAGSPVLGNGQTNLIALPLTSSLPSLVRVRVLSDNPAVGHALGVLSGMDFDGDGFSDVSEYAAGTDPFNPSSKLNISSLTVGRAAVVRFPTLAGKKYHVSSRDAVNAGAWLTEGGWWEGTGGTVEVAVELTAEQRLFRVQISDNDSDLDGISDWEEKLAGLEVGPWHYRTNYPTASAAVSARLTATNVVTVEAGEAVANVTRMLPGSFRLNRVGNLLPLTIHYTVSGSASPGVDYQALSGVINLPAGVDFIEIPVAPLGSSEVQPSRSVTVTLQSGAGFVLGANAVATVNVLKEALLSVKDFGAAGDGMTDDTMAIQGAINALELNANFNTLHFPNGTYRLNSYSSRTVGGNSWNEALRLGISSLTGRDIFFTGATGAVLFSTLHDKRVHMIHADASFRSLTFRGLTWLKESTPLPETPPGQEPNQANGVNLLGVDLRRVELVGFYDCVFNNCHGAASAFGVGYDMRGKLANFVMQDCTVLNPYGSNTTNAWTALGGGQQIRLGPWVGRAYYEGNLFDGGTAGAIDYTKNPGGIRKDGSHIGSPLHLIFTNNVLRRMAIEAVHQNDDPYMATTKWEFVVPPPDGTPVQSAIQPALTTFVPGQLLNYRTFFLGGQAATNIFFRVVAYDPNNQILTITNTGITTNVAGVTVGPWNSIYLQDYNPARVNIEGNLIEEGEPSGFNGITANGLSVVRNNFIRGYGYGVHIYESARNLFFPATAGSLHESNIIYARNAVGSYAYGLSTYGPGEIVVNNLVVTPVSYRFTGVVTRDDDGWLEGNTVIPQTVQYQGYGSIARSVGIGFANNTSGGTAAANRTTGMDVGVGPESAYQIAPHRVINHFSTNDVLAIDPVGLVN
jgi:hypothetical protein